MNLKFLVIIVVIIVAAGIVFGFWQYQKTRAEAKEFVGKVVKVESNTVTVEGVYIVLGRPDLSGPDKAKTVTVLLDAQTRLIKELLYLPSAEEVKDTGGRYNPSELKREEMAGSLDDLKDEGVSVRVIAAKNIYGRSSFFAKEIRYIEPVFPD